MINRHPLWALILAVIFAGLGMVLLGRGNVVIGAFVWWACGVNTVLACRVMNGKQVKK